MELDTRKNEARADLKRQDLLIEVRHLSTSRQVLGLNYQTSTGSPEQVNCCHKRPTHGCGGDQMGEYAKICLYVG